MGPFPDSWTVHPTVERSGGTDARGNPLEGRLWALPPCLIAPGLSTDPEDYSAALEGKATLYARTRLELQPRDVVRIPDGEHMAGSWEVMGRPEEWPAGTVARLERA